MSQMAIPFNIMIPPFLALPPESFQYFSGKWTTEIPFSALAAQRDVVMWLSQPLPQNQVLVLYQTTDNAAFSVVGYVDNEKPSATCKLKLPVGFPAGIGANSGSAAMKLGLSLEDASVTKNLEEVSRKDDFARDDLISIARDCYNYLASFGDIKEERLNGWIARFETKWRREGRFWEKGI